MEKHDVILIEKLISKDDELKKHVYAHRAYEKKLEEFKNRVYLTSEEELEEKRIKKLKLKARDTIEHILGRYRNSR